MDGFHDPQLGELDNTLKDLTGSTKKFNKQSSQLSKWMLVLAITTTIVASITLGFSMRSEKSKKRNLLFSVYKELSYNKEISDVLISRKDEFKKPGNMFFKDFQFGSYEALLQNMTVREELAESIMDTYRRLGIMQKSIEQARRDPVNSVQYFDLAISNINAGLEKSMMYAIGGLRKLTMIGGITPTLVNSTGLGLDIIGVILIFFFGIPPKIDREGYVHIIAEQTDVEEKRKVQLYDRLSNAALILIIVGFILQLASNFF